LLKDKEGPELAAVQSARRTVESRLGKRTTKSDASLPPVGRYRQRPSSHRLLTLFAPDYRRVEYWSGI
jgi:hypothetical protein